MKQFTHVVNDPLGLLIRPADMIAKLSKQYCGTTITVSCNGKQARAASLGCLMRLGARKGNLITVTVDGQAEEDAALAMEILLRDHL